MSASYRQYCYSLQPLLHGVMSKRQLKNSIKGGLQKANRLAHYLAVGTLETNYPQGSV